MIHVTYRTHLSVFKVLKSTRRTPLGIFKDFITSARKRRNFVMLQLNVTNDDKDKLAFYNCVGKYNFRLRQVQHSNKFTV